MCIYIYIGNNDNNNDDNDNDNTNNDDTTYNNDTKNNDKYIRRGPKGVSVKGWFAICVFSLGGLV